MCVQNKSTLFLTDLKPFETTGHVTSFLSLSFFLCFSLRTMHSTGLTHTSNRRSSFPKLHSQSMLQDIILHHLLFKPFKKGHRKKRLLKNGSSWGTLSLLLLLNHEKVQRYPALHSFCRACKNLKWQMICNLKKKMVWLQPRFN